MGLLDFILMKNLFGSSGGSSGGSGGNALCVLLDPEKPGESTDLGCFITSDVPPKAESYLCTLFGLRDDGVPPFEYYNGIKFDAMYIPADGEGTPTDLLIISIGNFSFTVIFDDWEGEFEEGVTISLKKGIYTQDMPISKGLLLIVPNMEHL